VDIRTTAELLGHSDVQTTLNTYAHSDDAAKRAAAKKIFL
jgi:integrase